MITRELTAENESDSVYFLTDLMYVEKLMKF